MEVEGSGEPDLVILVHGTFAGDKNSADEGERWWQRGSVTWRWLEANLLEGATLPDGDTRLFHWSGSNTQSERLKASSVLLAELIALEREGRGYHLVGHSHGGSVIWEALVSSEAIRSTGTVHRSLQRELRHRGFVLRLPSSPRRAAIARREAYREIEQEIRLDGLRSWTTLGTPFLHFLPKKRFLTRGVPDARLSLSSISMSGCLGVLLAVVIMGASSFAFLNLISRVHDVHTGIDLAKRFPLFFAVEYVALWIISRYQLAAAIKGRERVARRAMRKFYRRWLGLWAPNAEAILSLRHLSSCAEGHYEALCSGRSLAGHSTEPALNEWWSPSSLNLRLSSPRLTVDVLAEGGIVRLSSLLTPAYWFYNRLIAPRLASAISAALVRLAQGSDTPGAVLAYCSPCPVPITDLPPGLPEHVADSLEAEVASALGIAAPTIREMIIRSALNGASPVAATGLPRPGGSGALVHTAYFANADVLGLIAAHIVWGREGVDGKAAPTSSDRAHLWIKGNKEAVALVWAEHENRVGSHTGLRARCLCERCDI